MDTENSYRDNNSSIIDSEDSNDSQTSHFSGCSSVASNESSSKKRKLDQRSLIWSHFNKNITDKKQTLIIVQKATIWLKLMVLQITYGIIIIGIILKEILLYLLMHSMFQNIQICLSNEL